MTCNLTGPMPLHELIMIYHKEDFGTNLTQTQKYPSWKIHLKFQIKKMSAILGLSVLNFH